MRKLPLNSLAACFSGNFLMSRGARALAAASIAGQVVHSQNNRGSYAGD